MTIKSSTYVADGLDSGLSISWGAVFVGLLLTLVVSITMNVLGVAVGASTVTSLQDQGISMGSMASIGIGAGIWLVITMVVSSIVGAYFAGFFAPSQGEVHGLLAWAAAVLTTVCLVSTFIGGGIGSALNVVGKGLFLTAQLEQSTTPMLSESQQSDLSKLKNAVGKEFTQWLYKQPTQENTERMQEISRIAQKSALQMAWWTFVMLVLGALAAGGAGHFGYRQQSKYCAERSSNRHRR